MFEPRATTVRLEVTWLDDVKKALDHVLGLAPTLLAHSDVKYLKSVLISVCLEFAFTGKIVLDGVEITNWSVLRDKVANTCDLTHLHPTQDKSNKIAQEAQPRWDGTSLHVLQ